MKTEYIVYYLTVLGLSVALTDSLVIDKPTIPSKRWKIPGFGSAVDGAAHAGSGARGGWEGWTKSHPNDIPNGPKAKTPEGNGGFRAEQENPNAGKNAEPGPGGANTGTGIAKGGAEGGGKGVGVAGMADVGK